MQRKRYKRTGKRTGKYKSGLEDTVAKMLSRRDAKYETTRIPYVIPKNYIPDFTIKNNDGTIWHLEVKGWHRAEDQSKMRAVKFSNPEADIRFFFPKNGKVQGSSMLNSEWCEKYGFRYCIGKIPKGWFR